CNAAVTIPYASAYDECPLVQYDETAAGTFRGSVFPEKASVVRSPTFILFRRDKGAGTDWSPQQSKSYSISRGPVMVRLHQWQIVRRRRSARSSPSRSLGRQPSLGRVFGGSHLLGLRSLAVVKARPNGPPDR